MTSLESVRQCGTLAHGMLFKPGGVSITDTAWNALAQRQLTAGDVLQRHCAADWACMTEADRRRNLDALANGGRIVSSFQIDPDLRVWVITEADRSCTSILLPGEY